MIKKIICFVVCLFTVQSLLANGYYRFTYTAQEKESIESAILKFIATAHKNHSLDAMVSRNKVENKELTNSSSINSAQSITLCIDTRYADADKIRTYMSLKEELSKLEIPSVEDVTVLPEEPKDELEVANSNLLTSGFYTPNKGAIKIDIVGDYQKENYNNVYESTSVDRQFERTGVELNPEVTYGFSDEFAASIGVSLMPVGVNKNLTVENSNTLYSNEEFEMVGDLKLDVDKVFTSGGHKLVFSLYGTYPVGGNLVVDPYLENNVYTRRDVASYGRLVPSLGGVLVWSLPKLSFLQLGLKGGAEYRIGKDVVHQALNDEIEERGGEYSVFGGGRIEITLFDSWILGGDITYKFVSQRESLYTTSQALEVVSTLGGLSVGTDLSISIGKSFGLKIQGEYIKYGDRIIQVDQMANYTVQKHTNVSGGASIIYLIQ